jgi:hypothetical protein
VNPHIDNPFNANVDAGWKSPRFDAGLASPTNIAAQASPGWKSPSFVTTPNSALPAAAKRKTNDAGWQSPRFDQSTGKTAEIEAAIRREGGARDPQAAAAATRAKMIGRPALQRKAAAARRSSDNAGPIKGDKYGLDTFTLYHPATDTHYPLNKPLSADFTPLPMTSGLDEVTEDAGGGAGGWGHGGLAPPTQQGAHAQGGDAAWTANTDPAAPAGTPSINPPAPPSGIGGGMRGGTSQGMPGSVGMNAGPKMQHSVRYSYPDGTIDEHKITRPGGPSMGQQPQDAGWTSPQWPQQQQQPQDAGWINAGTLGQSPKGGRAGSRSGMSRL